MGWGEGRSTVAGFHKQGGGYNDEGGKEKEKSRVLCRNVFCVIRESFPGFPQCYCRTAFQLLLLFQLSKYQCLVNDEAVVFL